MPTLGFDLGRILALHRVFVSLFARCFHRLANFSFVFRSGGAISSVLSFSGAGGGEVSDDDEEQADTIYFHFSSFIVVRGRSLTGCGVFQPQREGDVVRSGLHDDDTSVPGTAPSSTALCFDGFVLENCDCTVCRQTCRCELCQQNAESISFLPVRIHTDDP